MPDFQEQNDKILAACQSGDLDTLKHTFEQLNIGPDHPKHDWNFDPALSSHEHPPSVYQMIHQAIQARNVPALTFLHTHFPSTSLQGGPIASAIHTQDLATVQAICALDPAAANSASSAHGNILALACAGPSTPAQGQHDHPAPAIVRTLLREGGADPNRPPEHIPPYSNISYAVTGNMPLATFEDFFDAGYHCNDRWCMDFAIRQGRYDVVELLFTRGKDLPTAWYAPQEELVGLALAEEDEKMADLIRRLYPARKTTGLVAALVRKMKG